MSAVMDALDRLDQRTRTVRRDIGIARGDELVLAHPIGGHGIFMRDDGSVDIASGTQTLGINGLGMVGDFDVIDLQSSVFSVRSTVFWINTAKNGLVIDGYVPDYGIVHGDLIGRYLRDASVVITRGSLKEVQKGGGSVPRGNPVCSHCPSLVSVPLSSLIQPFGWSKPLDSRILNKFNSVMQRIRGGSS